MIEYDPLPFYKTKATKTELVEEVAVVDEEVPANPEVDEVPKRTREEDGKFIADDPTTATINEAWTTGKSPAKHKK